MTTQYEMCGAIKSILEPKTFASGFTKREFVLTTEEDYPQQVLFECVKQQAGLLDQVVPNDRVRVQFRIRGSATKDGARFFVNLQALQIEKMGVDGSTVTLDQDAPPPTDDDPMPF